MMNITSNDATGFVLPSDFRSSAMSENGVFHFCNDFTHGAVKEVINWIFDSNLQDKSKFDHLTLMITSYGGDLTAAFALIDVMRGSSIPIHTIGLGVVASAGLMTFIAGEPGYRMVTPNTSILSHQWSWGMFGKEHELIASAKQGEIMTQRVMAHYRKCTKLTDKIIREKLLPPQDVWMTAQEAKKYKLVDMVKELR